MEDPEVAQDLVRTAHAVCPYSNATRGNIDVAISVNGRPIEGRPDGSAGGQPGDSTGE